MVVECQGSLKVFEASRGELPVDPISIEGLLPSIFAPPAEGAGSSGRARLSGEVFNPEMRPWFVDLTSRELGRMRRHGRHLSVLYIDLDDLRQINLRHGRPAGDRVLGVAAAAVRSICRAEDYFWHLSEDEFAVVMSETGSHAAQAAALRLATAIRTAEYDIDVPVSASIGISTYPEHGENVDDLFARARAEMYLVKSKNKITALAKEKILDRHIPAIPKKEFAEADWAGAQEHEKAVTVLIAAASPLLLAGMRQVLTGKEGVETVSEITDAQRLPAAVADVRPDIAFIDWQMAIAGDYAMLRLIESENLPSKVAVLATEVDEEAIRLISDFPVDGIILQSSSAEEVLAELNKIYRGRTVMPMEVRLALSTFENKKRALGELSEREAEVLRLVAEGKSNSQIAAELFISVNTVRFHLANIYPKLNVSNRTEAANYYLRRYPAANGQTRLL